MKPYKEIERQLKKFGYSKKDNISDFWFANEKDLMPKIYGKGVHNGRFGLQVRWKSEKGIACQNAIIDYINRKVSEHKKKQSEAFDPIEFTKCLNDKNKKYSYPISLLNSYVSIDFKDFSFDFKGDKLTILDFEYSFPGQRSSYTSLSGIDLSGIRIENCIFKNISFSSANFDNVYFFQVKFDNCSLGYCSFKNSALISLGLNDTVLSGEFSGSSLNIITPFNDRTIQVPFEIKKINYFRLLMYSFKALNWKNRLNFKNSNHTKFTTVTTKDIESPQLIELKYYIDWYQKTIDNIHMPVRNTLGKRLKFFLSVLFTKNWTSFSVLAIWFFILNFVYSLFIYFGSCHFKSSTENFDPDIFQAFYHSIITFSILGYGDLNPIDNWGRILVLSETIIGYIILGLFIFLLNRKIEKKI